MNASISAPPSPPAASPRDITIDEGTDAVAWDAYVARHPEATGYHRWRWRHVFERGLGHSCRYLVARDGDRIVGICPLVEVKSWLFSRALSSLPYVNYGGILADTPQIGERLVEQAGAIASERGLDHVVLRHRRRVIDALPARTHKVTMVVTLQGNAETFWNELDRKVRNQVRKAEKSGLTLATGGIDLLDAFYTIFARNMRDLGTPVYGRELFAEILQQEPEDARLHVVSLGDAPIAAALSYEYGDTLEVPSASSLKEHRSLCPNHLLYWSMIQRALANGRTRFDFGRSTPGDGTFQFKEQWGAQEEQLFWEYRLIKGDLPTDDRHSARYQKRIELWKRLPLSVASFLGPQIARGVA